jgi:hypothetical protein
MKPFMILASCFILAVVQVATAGDKGSNQSAPAPAPARAAAPAPSAHRSGVNAPHNRFAAMPNGNVRRNYPGMAQLRRNPLSVGRVTPQGTFRNHQTRQNAAAVAALSTSVKRSQPRETADASREIVNRSQRREKTVANRETFKDAKNNRTSYFDALKRHRGERHDCNWWRKHFPIIVFVNTGYYFWDAGYWYPAWGYDPLYDYYDYDGPIYTYGELLPDQVIANVQSALQEEGYYSGPITGSLSPLTRAALATYQRDHGLIATGAIDEPTIESLGLD